MTHLDDAAGRLRRAAEWVIAADPDLQTEDCAVMAYPLAVAVLALLDQNGGQSVGVKWAASLPDAVAALDAAAALLPDDE